MFQLRYNEGGLDKVHQLMPGVTVVGRLPACNLVISDISVSRKHASLRLDEAGRLFLQDTGSRFGTFRNGQQVLIEEVALAPTDTIKLGEVTLTLEQNVSEKELLTENHEVAEGPGTIVRKVAGDDQKTGVGTDSLVRLLSDVGRTLLGSQSLPDILNRVVEMAFAAVPAERAFLLLRDSPDAELSARVLRKRDGSTPPNATLSRTVVRRVLRERISILAADAATDPKLGVTDSILSLSIRSFMCAPLWNRDDVIGVLYVDSPRISRFGPSDLDAFTALANAAAIAIEQARLSSQLLEETRRRERLQRYHSPAVVSRILHDSGADGGGMHAQEREVSVMFCDLVGFTTLCEGLPPTQAASLLNSFLTSMTDVVFDHEGTLDKFIGDALLAVFGAPLDQPDHALKAVNAAVMMRKALAELNERRGGQPLAMRIVINTGIGITGDIGSPRRREFTVLGDVVNTAARMEDEIAGPGQIVIAQSTYLAVKDQIKARSLGTKTLRGRATPIETFAVED